jgi:hypothetical protein
MLARRSAVRKTAAIAIVLGCLSGLAPGTAQAGGATSAALGLGAFAVFNQILGGIGIFGLPWAFAAPAYYPPYYYPAPAYYPPPAYAPTPAYRAPLAYAAPTPAHYSPAPRPAYTPPMKTEVVYAHGRYVLRGDGVSVAYRWVWVPNPPPPPPPVAQR